MKKIFPFLLLSAVIFFAGCGDDEPNMKETTTLTLNVGATFGEEPLVMFEEVYDYQGQPLQLQLFQMYLTDLHLIYEEEGVEQEMLLAEVVEANFGSIFSTTDALAGLDLLEIEVPARNYTALRVGLGVSPELNATIPPDYELTHPLSQNYWEDASSYIFFKVEGNTDVDGDSELSDKLTFHVGGNNNYREVTLNKAIDLQPNTTANLKLNIDLEKIMISEDGESIDFSNVRQAHSTTSPAAVFMGENLSRAVELE
jgi:hypothetical protein